MKRIDLNLIRIFVLLVAVLFTSSKSFARNYSYHEGYTSNPEAERSEVISEMTVIQAPASNQSPLQERIFDEKLTKDFRERYEQKFGRTEAERVYYSPNRFTYYNDLYTFKGSPEEEDGEKRAYANYMVRKLIEYHAENYAKDSKSLHAVWEAKQNLQQVQLKSKKFKVRAKYDLVGGKADIDVENPWVNTKYTLDLKGGSKVEESLLILNKPITKTITLESRWKSVEGILAFIGSKSLGRGLSSNITVSTFTNDSKKSTRESLYLAGMSYVF